MTEKIEHAWTDPRGMYGRPATLVENVAFAICSSTPCICRNKAGFEGMPCLDRARRALIAMRDLTHDIRNVSWDYGTGQHWDHLWRAMIDAALKEDKP